MLSVSVILNNLQQKYKYGGIIQGKFPWPYHLIYLLFF